MRPCSSGASTALTPCCDLSLTRLPAASAFSRLRTPLNPNPRAALIATHSFTAPRPRPQSACASPATPASSSSLIPTIASGWDAFSDDEDEDEQLEAMQPSPSYGRHSAAGKQHSATARTSVSFASPLALQQPIRPRLTAQDLANQPHASTTAPSRPRPAPAAAPSQAATSAPTHPHQGQLGAGQSLSHIPSELVGPTKPLQRTTSHGPPIFSDHDPDIQTYAHLPVTIIDSSSSTSAPLPSSSPSRSQPPPLSAPGISASLLPGKLKPVLSFNQLARKPYRFSITLLERFAAAGYRLPSPIQQHVIPLIHAGRDVIAISPNGSGKTAAYLFPLLGSLIKGNRSKLPNNRCYPTALILAPSRELVHQVHGEVERIIRRTNLKAVALTGGETIMEQMFSMRGGADLLVATPGRLWELMSSGRVRLDNVRLLVLDEADKMCSSGFEEQLRRLMTDRRMPPPPECQTVLLSAVLPEAVQALASSLLHDHVYVQAGSTGASAPLVQQRVELLVAEDKVGSLLRHLSTHSDAGSALVFTNTVDMAKQVHAHVCSMDLPVGLLHGELPQMLRDEAMTCFRFGVTSVLVCTGVMARGMDLPGTSLVVNFDVPQGGDEYMHRIGRTGRGGKPGVAVTLFTPADGPQAAGVIQGLSSTGQEVPAWLQEMEAAAVASSSGRGGSSSGRGSGRHSGGRAGSWQQRQQQGGRSSGRGGAVSSGDGAQEGGRSRPGGGQQQQQQQQQQQEQQQEDVEVGWLERRSQALVARWQAILDPAGGQQQEPGERGGRGPEGDSSSPLAASREGQVHRVEAVASCSDVEELDEVQVLGEHPETRVAGVLQGADGERGEGEDAALRAAEQQQEVKGAATQQQERKGPVKKVGKAPGGAVRKVDKAAGGSERRRSSLFSLFDCEDRSGGTAEGEAQGARE